MRVRSVKVILWLTEAIAKAILFQSWSVLFLESEGNTVADGQPLSIRHF